MASKNPFEVLYDSDKEEEPGKFKEVNKEKKTPKKKSCQTSKPKNRFKKNKMHQLGGDKLLKLIMTKRKKELHTPKKVKDLPKACQLSLIRKIEKAVPE